jgi:prepilin-type N-terminal cleavage/methylation domain-containing protein
MQERERRVRGFTLIELLIIIVVLGILASAVILALGGLEPVKKEGHSTTTKTIPAKTSIDGVYATPLTQHYNRGGGADTLVITNLSKVSALKITIEVAQSAGVRYRSMLDSYPLGYFTQKSSVVGGFLDYVFVLTPGNTIPAKFVGGEVGGRYYAGPGGHNLSGDLWSVTSTTNGETSTIYGSF